MDMVNQTDKKEFSFDRVFDMESLQKDVFDFAAKPTIEDVVEG